MKDLLMLSVIMLSIFDTAGINSAIGNFSLVTGNTDAKHYINLTSNYFITT